MSLKIKLKQLPKIFVISILCFVLFTSNSSIPNLLAKGFSDPEEKNEIYPESLGGVSGWKIDNDDWNESAVRRVIYTFAFGGPATEKQIKKWAKMKPDIAIKEILNFKPINKKLSHPVPNKNGKASTHSFFTNGKNLTLRKLAEYFISGSGPVKLKGHSKGIDQWELPGRVWTAATQLRGINPFRQKIGLFETNYHLAVNLHTEVMERQIYNYYDDIMKVHENGKKNYDYVMYKAATSAAVATQYRHRENRYEKSQFFGNEDFGREFHQLFFKIYGLYAKDTKKFKPAIPNKPLSNENNDYHEYTTIRNTARALSGMTVPGMKWPRDMNTVDKVKYNDKFSGGWPEDEIEILGHTIKGKTAKKKLRHLTKIAIQHEESERNIPVYIIRVLADDNLVEDGNESSAVKDKLKTIRALWKGLGEKKKYNFLKFIRMYAISNAFHNKSRYKYLTSIDRYALISKLSMHNEEQFNHYRFDWRIAKDGVTIFKPLHDVFGGQTGIEASNTADVFKNAYNTAVKEYWWAGKSYEGDWKNPKWMKNYSKVIPYSYKEKGKKVWKVVDVGKWLWLRYTGSLKNFGFQEKMQVYSFIASGQDFALFIAGDSWNNPPSKSQLRIKYTKDYVMNNPNVRKKWEDLQKGIVFLDTKESKKRREVADNIGLAINFITATPYMFVQEGSED